MAGRVSHPLDDKQGFMKSSHTPFPLDQPCLVALPPNTEDDYQYTYNLLRFERDACTEDLKIEIIPRTWNEQEMRFDADTRQFGTDRLQHVLRCPNFKNRAVAASVHTASRDCRIEATRAVPAEPIGDTAGGNAMGSSSDLLRLHFFRDLSAEQRVQALVKVGLLPKDWAFELTHTEERRLFDRALSSDLEDKLASAVRILRTASVSTERGEEA